MKLTSKDKASSISLRVLELQEEHYPSVSLSVEIADGGFCGAAAIWVAAQEWDGFVEQLQQCELDRCGSASLVSMDPDEFELRVESCDNLGHFVTRYELMRRSFSRAGTIARTLSGGFDLDSELLARAVQEFVRFAYLAVCRANHDGAE